MRTAYHVIEGKEAPEDAFTDVRGTEGRKVREFTLGGATLRTCTVSGLGNAGKLLDELKAGKVHYDFVEVMACPGGCIAGAGTVQPPEKSRRLLEQYKAQAPKSNPVESDYTEYLQIIRENKPMQRLMIAGAGTKLALSIANNTTVLCMLYGCMMGAYDGLYLPMMVLGYACSVPFFILSVRTSQKKGQKASLTKYVSVALACYVGVLVLLLLWGHGDAFHLSLLGENGLSINLYTILFILFFGIGYGAYYATADMPIPMVADCSDYETYRSGKYIPGIMGTLFSLVDKLVSSLSATVVGIAVTFIGLNNLPTQYDPYTPGMNVVVIVLFCAIPMVAWAATLIAMKGYTLTGEKMKEIQAVNACRRDAVANGMKLEEAMTKWQSMDQLPAEYRS